MGGPRLRQGIDTHTGQLGERKCKWEYPYFGNMHPRSLLSPVSSTMLKCAGSFQGRDQEKSKETRLTQGRR